MFFFRKTIRITVPDQNQETTTRMYLHRLSSLILVSSICELCEIILLIFFRVIINHCCFYSFNPSLYYSIAIIVLEKVHIDIHPRKKEVRF